MLVNRASRETPSEGKYSACSPHWHNSEVLPLEETQPSAQPSMAFLFSLPHFLLPYCASWNHFQMNSLYPQILVLAPAFGEPKQRQKSNPVPGSLQCAHQQLHTQFPIRTIRQRLSGRQLRQFSQGRCIVSAILDACRRH